MGKQNHNQGTKKQRERERRAFGKPQKPVAGSGAFLPKRVLDNRR